MKKTMVKGKINVVGTWVVVKDINMDYWHYGSYNNLDDVKYILNHVKNTYVFHVNEVTFE